MKKLLTGAVLTFVGSVVVWVGYHNQPWTFSSYALMGCGAFVALVGIFRLLGMTKYERKLGFGSSNLLAGLLIALIAIGLGVAFATHRLSITNVPGVQGTQTQTTSAEKLALNLPVKFIFYNAISGSVFTPSSLKVYDSSGHLLETLTPSAGSATTSFPYMSGTVLILRIGVGNAFYYKQVTVPYYNKDVALATRPTVHLIRVTCVDVPSSLSVRAYDNLGNTIASGAYVNVSTVTPISISVINSQANTALPEPFMNIVTGTKYGNYLVIKVTGTTTNVPLITGATPVYTGPGVAVYILPLNTLPAKTDVRSGTVIPASQSFGISIDPAGTHGNYTVTISAYTDLDVSYMQKSAGTPNTDAVLLGTFSFIAET